MERCSVQVSCSEVQSDGGYFVDVMVENTPSGTAETSWRVWINARSSLSRQHVLLLTFLASFQFFSQLAIMLNLSVYRILCSLFCSACLGKMYFHVALIPSSFFDLLTIFRPSFLNHKSNVWKWRVANRAIVIPFIDFSQSFFPANSMESTKIWRLCDAEPW